MTAALTPDELERNQILASWFKSKQMDVLKKILAKRKPCLKELGMIDDCVQELFISFANKENKFLRYLNEEERWKGYLYKSLVVYQANNINTLHPEINTPSLEFKDEIYESIIVEDTLEVSCQTDLLDATIVEIRKLTYLEGLALITFAKYPNTHKVLSILNGRGEKMMFAKLQKLLSAARDKVQTGLIQNEVIARKTPYVRAHKYMRKSHWRNTNELRIAGSILRLVSMQSKAFSHEWSIPEKCLHVIMQKKQYCTRLEILEALLQNNENEANSWDIPHLISQSVRNGILSKRDVKKKAVKYGFPQPLAAYFQQLNDDNQFDSFTNSMPWKFYSQYYGTHLSVEEIASRFSVPEPVVQQKIILAKNIIDALLQEKQLSKI